MSVVIKGSSNVNLDFTTGGRITGDFSNATAANRVFFQTSTANTFTAVGLITSGTGTYSEVSVLNSSDPANASIGYLAANGSTDIRLVAASRGTGTNLPLTFFTSSSERLRIDTSGNVGIGTNAPISTFGRSLHLYNDASTGTVASNTYLLVESSTRNAVLELSGSSTSTNSLSFSDTPGTTVAAIVSTAAEQNLVFRTGGTGERMRIASSGNVGIGTIAPQAKLVVSNSGAAGLEIFSNYPGGGVGTYLQSYNRSTSAYVDTAYTALSHVFEISGSERARIDSSGNLLVGATTVTSGGKILVVADSSNVAYFRNTAGTGVYLVSGGNSWTASSDERLKTNFVPFENAAEKVATLRAGTGRYLTDAESVSRSFLIAQDVQKVLPEAVSVQEDEQKTLGLSYTDLIPLLTAAIQELKAELDTVKAELAAMKGTA